MNKIMMVAILAAASIAPAVAAETLTPYQAAYFDYALDKGYEIPPVLIDQLNDFVFNGEDDVVRAFVKERDRYEDGYTPELDCRNPDMTPEQFAKTCS